MKIPRAVRFLVFALLLLVIPAALTSPSLAQIGIGISVRIGPPALPVYEQPLCPGPGFLWTPGYWAWSDDDGYYWVPGTWVEAPSPGLLWTPGYWGWNDGVYAFNAGYWGPHVGFYGGINYGFGYGGEGFGGGEWRGGTFFYNTAVVRVNTTTITNVYVNRTVIVNNTSHVAFNGGQGGVQRRPTAQEEQFTRETHTPPVSAQVTQAHAASQNRALFASTNHGRPAVAATARPGEFSGRGVVPAKAAGAAYHAPAMSPKEARASAPAGNRGAENRPAENKPAANRPAENRGTANRPAADRPAENRPAPSNGAREANRPSPKESTPARNDRPPSANHATSSERDNAPRATAPRANESRPAESHAAKPAPAPSSHASEPRKESTPRAENPRPAPKPRAETAPKEAAAPKHESAPRQPAPKQSPPKESAPKTSARPAPAAKPSPPAKQSAPKEEHKNKGN